MSRSDSNVLLYLYWILLGIAFGSAAWQILDLLIRLAGG